MDQLVKTYIYTHPNVSKEDLYKQFPNYDKKDLKRLANFFIKTRNTGVQVEPLVVTPMTHGTLNYNLIDESHLAGGTKSRAAGHVLKKIQDPIVTPGLSTGWGQVALAIAATQTKKHVTVIIDDKETDVSKYAEYLADERYFKIIRTPDDVFKVARERSVDATLLELGIDTPEFQNVLEDKLGQAFYNWDPNYKTRIKRIWVVWGSGGICRVLYRLLPRTHFCVVQIGKAIRHELLEPSRTTVYFSSRPTKYQLENKTKYGTVSRRNGHPSNWRNSQQGTVEYGRPQWQEARATASDLPPYPSVSTYDAKIWRFAKVDMRDDDFIFNVAADQ